MKKPFRALAIGSLTTDRYALLPPALCANKGFEIPLGEKYALENTASFVGGGGANVASHLARAGVECGLLAAAGRGDQTGIEQLNKTGVDTRLVQHIEGQPTGSSIILQNKEGRRSVLFSAGANAALAPPAPHDVYDASLISLCRVASKSAKKGIADAIQSWKASKQNAFLSWNPGSQTLSNPPDTAPLLSLADALLLNREELQAWTGKTTERDGVAALREAGCHAHIFVTLGPEGALAFGGESAQQQVLRAGILADFPCRDALGAGDAFHAGAALSLAARGQDLRTALKTATIFAAVVVGARGAHAATPSPAQLADSAPQVPISSFF